MMMQGYAGGTLDSCTFSGNTASRGGGLYVDTSTPTITSCTFSNNTTSLVGGGLYVYNTSLTIPNAVFYQNSSFAGGGLVVSPFGYVSLTNAVFAHNSAASTDGGGVLISNDGYLELTHCTLYGNQANSGAGGGMRMETTAGATITGSIFWGNTDYSMTAYDISYASNMPVVSYSTIESGFFGGSTANPVFESTSDLIGPDGAWRTDDDGLRLQNGSPAINGGSPFLKNPALDITGVIRVMTLDRGAYENSPCIDLGTSSRLYVDGSASGGVGTSWAAAYNNLSDALWKASQCAVIVDEVWVKAGTYLPSRDSLYSPTVDVEATFVIPSGVAVYGGFAGGETSINGRDLAANETILSGDVNLSGVDNDNSYHVVMFRNTDYQTRLNGFTITKGYANGGGLDDAGGGVLVDGSFGSGSEARIDSCIILNNHADGSGGGIYAIGSNHKATVVLENCMLANNTASANGGGGCIEGNGGELGWYMDWSVLLNNSAGQQGGGFYTDGTGSVYSSISLSQGTFYGNTGLSGGGALHAQNSYTDCRSNIFWNNGPASTAISYAGSAPSIQSCILEDLGGYAGNYNDDRDPLFVSTTDLDGADNHYLTDDDGLRLSACSPAIGAGYDFGIRGSAQTIDRPDMGAYEFVGTTIERYYVNASALGLNTGISWTDAFTSLGEALYQTALCPVIKEVWVAGGVYYPTRDVTFSTVSPVRERTFLIPNGLTVIGGFAGGEADPGSRPYPLASTVLSGDLDANDTNIDGNFIAEGTIQLVGDNAFHVVTLEDLNTSTILDGLIITAGKADDNATFLGLVNGNQKGAGIFCKQSEYNVSLDSCTIIGNYALADGGGMFTYAGSQHGSPYLNQCLFSGNAAANGGAMFNWADTDNAQPNLYNTIFDGNYATARGGAIYNLAAIGNGSMEGSNLIFVNNAAGTEGGAIYHTTTNTGVNNATIYNSVFSNNSASNGGSILADGASAIFSITNTVFYNGSTQIQNSGSASFLHCLLQGSGGSSAWNAALGTDNGGNLDANPQFVNAVLPAGADGIWRTADDGLIPYRCSPLVNAGINEIGEPVYDIRNEGRNEMPEIGPYEVVPAGNLVLHVKHAAGGNGSGDSWANAIEELGDALANHTNCAGTVEFWVAAGTYYPTRDHTGAGGALADERTKTFKLYNDQVVYGGFAGTETSFSQRTQTTKRINVTLLSGDIGTVANAEDNVYHVVTLTNLSSAVIDGVTISDGNADNGTDTYLLSGGNVVYHNRGGGVFVEESTNGAVLHDCVVRNNSASAYGGGWYGGLNNTSRSENVIFAENSSNDRGGGVAVIGNSPSFENCVFAMNNATNFGGGLYHSDAWPTLNRCTFADNVAASAGGGVATETTTSAGTLTDCIIWNNIPSGIYNISSTMLTVNSSIDAQGYGGNSNTDPLFSDATDLDGDDNIWGTTDDGLIPASASPAKDASSSTTGLATDAAGAVRYQANAIDWGAYEVVYAPRRIYVDTDATTGSNNGTSWANAYLDLQQALNSATRSDSLWVAEGSYYPSLDVSGNINADNRNHTFLISQSVLLYGGFSGVETALSERDFTLHPTILSGDIGVAGDPTDNCFQVVTISGVDTIATLSGFVIRDGYDLFGAGLLVQNSSQVRISNCVITNNNSGPYNGGGVLVSDGAPRFISTVIINNSAGSGAGVALSGAAVAGFYNCVVAENTAANYGGGFFIQNYATGNIFNTTIVQNVVGASGSALMLWVDANANVGNSIIYGNAGTELAHNGYNVGGDLTNSIIPGCPGWPYYCTNTLNVYPLFTNLADLDGADNTWFTADDGLQLLCGSPAVDAGANLNVPAGTTDTDLLGTARTQGAAYDLGAYERLAFTLSDTRLYVDPTAAGGQQGLDWANAFAELRDALVCAQAESGINEIWVAAGTYQPTSGTARATAFTVRSNLAVYGGFAGTEAVLGDRTVIMPSTSILTGEIGTAGDADNCYHVVQFTGTDNTAILDGFTIDHGNADSTGGTYNKGGGILIDAAWPQIRNCTISSNLATDGAGVAIINPGTNAAQITEMNNCTILNNTATNSGGGIYAEQMMVRFTGGTTISGNTATGSCE